MKKTLLLLTALFTFTFVSAQNAVDSLFTVDNLTYKVTAAGFPSTVEVASRAEDSTDIILDIPGSVTDEFGVVFTVSAIGESAFVGAGITEVTLPPSVAEIKQRVFRREGSLTKINLENVVTIGPSAFDRTQLKYADLSSVVTLGNFNFYQVALDSVKMSVVQSIDHNALRQTALKRVELPRSLSFLGHIAFEGCNSLTQVKVNWVSASEILDITQDEGNDVFSNGVGIENLTLYVPEGTKALYEAAPVWQDFGTIEEGDFPAPSNDPALGDEFTDGNFNYVVTNVPNLTASILGMVEGSEGVTEVVIPDTATDPKNETAFAITSVGADAFVGNVAITSVQLNAAITSIANNSFRGCVSLTTINLENIITLGNNTFQSTAITTANLESATTVGNFTFFQSAVENLNIPVLQSVSHNAFRQIRVQQLTIPASLTTAQNLLFAEIDGLSQVKVSWNTAETILSIAIADTTQAFFLGSDLATMKLFVPAGTKELYEAAPIWQDFGTIEEGVEFDNEFVGQRFSAGDYNYAIASLDPFEAVLQGTSNAEITAINPPANVVNPIDSETYATISIETAAFYNKVAATSVTIPETVTTINADAFYGTGLTQLNIPAAVTSIGARAFALNLAFTEVQYDADSIALPIVQLNTLSEVQVNWLADETILNVAQDSTFAVFEGHDLSTIKLLVPEGTKDLYESKEVWQDFNIEEIVLSTDAIARDLGFNIYPNPVKDIVFVNNSELLNTTVSIIDMNGRVLSTQTANNSNNSIDVSNLASGVYLMKVTTDEYTFVERIIKQ